MSHTISGSVHLIQEAQTFASGFTKREFVLKVEDGKYEQFINLEFVQDNVSKLDGLNEGDFVTIDFNIRGREYNGRYFNNLVCWRINVEKQAETSGNNDIEDFRQQLESPSTDADPLNGGEFDSEIPF